MSEHYAYPCWEIIQCNKVHTCPAKKNRSKACWQFVQEDDACSFNICLDCLVYIINQADSPLSGEEVMAIKKYKRGTLFDGENYLLLKQALKKISGIRAARKHSEPVYLSGNCAAMANG